MGGKEDNHERHEKGMASLQILNRLENLQRWTGGFIGGGDR